MIFLSIPLSVVDSRSGPAEDCCGTIETKKASRLNCYLTSILPWWIWRKTLNTKILTEANVVNRSPETSDKEGGLQEPAPEYTPRDDLFSQDATEEHKTLAREALADLGRLGIYDRRAKPRLLGSSILQEFAEKGRISLLGQKAETPEDLAVLVQIYRDPRVVGSLG